MRMRFSLLHCFVLLALLSLSLASAPLLAKAHVLLVGGLGGTAEYAEAFEDALSAIEENFAPGSQWLGGETVLSVLQGEAADRAGILAELDRFAQSSVATDKLIVMLVGHGSYDGEHYRFNIVGADLTDDDIKRALDAISAQQQLVVLATSASGVMLQQLKQAGRITITATKSGGEINAVVFPHYWATALSTDKADYDRNEIVTVAEAFEYTRLAVEQHYTEQNLLASEHARLLGEDAETRAVARIGSLKQAGDDPQITALLAQRADLESEIHALRARKESLALTAYYESLQELMLRMARLQINLDRKTGWLKVSE